MLNLTPQDKIKELNTQILFSNIKKEQMSLRPYRMKESLSHYSGRTDTWGYPKSKEYRAVLSWRLNTYTKLGKVKKSSILYRIFKRQDFTDRELALAETFAQWIGTYVGQSYIQSKLKIKGYEEYGVQEIPLLRYLLPDEYRTGSDYNFMEEIVNYFNTNKVNNYLKQNWMGLY